MKRLEVTIYIIGAVVLLVFILLEIMTPYIIGLAFREPERKPPVYDPDKPSEFFLIIGHDGEFRSKPENPETFVVANAPLDRTELMELVEDHNRRTITVDMISQNSIWRDFYYETEHLTRNFQRGEPYPSGWRPPWTSDDDERSKQDIRNHLEDKLIATSYHMAWEGHAVWVEFRLLGQRARFGKRIYDIHSYFADSEGNVPEPMPDIPFKEFDSYKLLSE